MGDELLGEQRRVVIEQPSEDGDRPSIEMAEISRTMVRIYKDHFGRGPTKAYSAWAGADILVCVLEETLTRAEQSLVELGEHQRLRDVRLFFQYATTQEFVDSVERLTGRTVRSFVSGIDSHEDLSMETFVFYPRGSEGPSRAEKVG
jgi:uncharacterized protein YbcI